MYNSNTSDGGLFILLRCSNIFHLLLLNYGILVHNKPNHTSWGLPNEDRDDVDPSPAKASDSPQPLSLLLLGVAWPNGTTSSILPSETR